MKFIKKIIQGILGLVIVLVIAGALMGGGDKSVTTEDKLKPAKVENPLPETIDTTPVAENTTIESSVKNSIIPEGMEFAKEISEEDYQFYKSVIRELGANYEMEEMEVYKKIAPDYGMTAEEMENHMNYIMVAAVQRELEENKAYAEDVKWFKENDTKMKTLANKFIEDIEKQAIKNPVLSAIDYQVKTYMSNPLKDKEGNEYIYTYQVNGKYEEKGTGRLCNFAMTLAFNNQDDLRNSTGYCLQYTNEGTGTFFSVVAPEFDLWD